MTGEIACRVKPNTVISNDQYNALLLTFKTNANLGRFGMLDL